MVLISFIRRAPRYGRNRVSGGRPRDSCISLAFAFASALIYGMNIEFALIIGGVIMIVIEKRIPSTLKPKSNVVSFKHALFIGLAQCFSLIPGVSRAASTIMGGLIAGLDRKTATEFSFFLAIPIIFAASIFDLATNINILSKNDLPIFAVGFITAFFSSYLIIKIFIQFVAHNTFIGFGWYRIIVGLITIYYFL